MSEILLKPLKAGLIGAGIQASLTPAMHMREGEAQGFSYDYELIDLNQIGATPTDLPRLLDEAEARGLAGLNITHPCKQSVIAHLDELSPQARDLGAVNTVVFRNGKRSGHNTDWWGFAESFRRGLPQADLSSALQLGAGAFQHPILRVERRAEEHRRLARMAAEARGNATQRRLVGLHGLEARHDDIEDAVAHGLIGCGRLDLG